MQYKAYPDYALEMGLIKKSSYDVINKIVPVCEIAIKLCGNCFWFFVAFFSYRANTMAYLHTCGEELR